MASPLGETQRRLRACIEAELKAQEPLDCVLVLDSSGSIQPSDFDIARQSAQRIIEIGSPSVRFGAINFSDEAQVLSQLTDKHAFVARAIAGCGHHQGGTITENALDAAGDLFQPLSRSKLVVLETDGHPNNPRVAAEADERLKAEGIKIVVVGIGNVSYNGLAAVASPDCVFLLDNFQQLLDTFVQGDAPRRDGELTLAISPPARPIGLDDDLLLELRVRNTTANTILDARIEAKESPQFHTASILLGGELKPGEERTLRLALPSKRSGIFCMANKLSLEANTIRLNPSSFQLSINLFSGDALAWRPSARPHNGPLGVNCLLFGRYGAGKSSFLNTLLAALSTSKQSYALTGGSSGHITDVLTRWQLGRLCCAAVKKSSTEQSWVEAAEMAESAEEAEGLATWPVSLWDTWGDDGANYTRQEFVNLLNGWIRSGTHMRDGLARNMDEEHREQRIMTALLLFLPQAAVLNDAAEVERTKDFYHAAQGLGLKPMVVVSQIDQETNGEVRKRMMEHLMANIGCASSDIVLFSSYTHESEEKDFVKDRLALHVLLEVQKRTDAFLAHLANR